jgi:hypothetical protein
LPFEIAPVLSCHVPAAAATPDQEGPEEHGGAREPATSTVARRCAAQRQLENALKFTPSRSGVAPGGELVP